MNVGILGAGAIAEKMAQTLKEMREQEIYCKAIASRTAEKAGEFAKKHNIEKAYGTYKEMAEDKEIDLIYIATPHSHHYEHAKLCMNAGRHVLVEKSFTINAKEAKELIKLSKEKNLLCAEAIWTRYMPSRFALDKILEAKIIGESIMLTANLGYDNILLERMHSPKLAGGALLDLGVYVINFALSVFGNQIESVEGSADLYHTGVDVRNNIKITFKNGKYADLYSSINEYTDKKGIIKGEGGYIEFENVNNCEWIRTYINGANTIHFDVPKQITGFEYQILSCKKVIEEGKIECPEMPHEEIIRVMEIMDSLRKKWGIIYPMENAVN